MMDYADALVWTRDHKAQIVGDAERGSQEAQAVIDVHRMLVRHSDPATIGVFLGALDTYRRSPKPERDPTAMTPEEFLARDNRALRAAGGKLAEAALYVVHNYDGLHRLSLAVSEWSQTVADEGGRPHGQPARDDTAELVEALKQAHGALSFWASPADRLEASKRIETALAKWKGQS